MWWGRWLGVFWIIWSGIRDIRISLGCSKSSPSRFPPGSYYFLFVSGFCLREYAVANEFIGMST